jgi:N-carbamoylputrescine amidase
MRIGFVEWPESLEPLGSAWAEIAARVAAAGIDLLVTNELPFGRWIAADAAFDPHVAQASINIHRAGLESFEKLDIPAVLSSRPVWADVRLANEAFVMEGGRIRRLHRKRYFPDEPGWFETNWYSRGSDRFEAADIGGVRTGVLLCTDAMFNEHARHYGRQGADLIAIPRAAGTSIDTWLAAGKMAAIVSGSYVVSSNRVGLAGEGVMFGGAGFAFHPSGSLLGTTTSAEPLLVINVDPAVSANQRRSYPCYVRDSDP